MLNDIHHEEFIPEPNKEGYSYSLIVSIEFVSIGAFLICYAPITKPEETQYAELEEACLDQIKKLLAECEQELKKYK